MTRRLATTLALLALTAALSAGLLHAQGSTEAEPPPYRIDLHPGWNLISFPGDPVDTAIESVMGNAQVDMILGYQDQQWGAAVRKADGGWRTTSDLTTMSGSRGYWVHALAKDAIEAALSPDTARPSIQTIAGWNLIGIWDADQRPHGTEVDAFHYLRDIPWRVAYTFDAAADFWVKRLPQPGETLETGRSYWVWVVVPGCLCP